MPAVKQKPRARTATGGEATPFLPRNDAARTKNEAGDPFPKSRDGVDANAAHEAELALQIALANKVLRNNRKLLRMLADR